MDDLISRQAAISAIGYCQTYLFDSRDKDKKISLEDAKYAIEQLPSAQPEIIRCKDCKYWTNNVGDYKLRDNYCNEKAHGLYYQCNGDDYCSFAERRTDDANVDT